MDEAQRFVTASPNYGEAIVLDLVREANCAVILATQSVTSLVAALGKDKANVLALNLRNRIGFKCADHEDALEAAGRLGKHRKQKVRWTYGRGGRQRNVEWEDQWIVRPDDLRRLSTHECLIVHSRGAHRRRILAPLLPDGTIAPWSRRWWRFWP